MLQSKFCFWTIKWISIQTGLHSVTWRLGFGPIPFKIGHSRPIGSKNDGSLTYGRGDFGCIPPQHLTQLPWPNQDPFEEKLAMDDIAYCLSYSELALILATAAINMLTLLAVCIMTRRQCIKDGSMSWHVYTESWIQDIHDTIHTCTAPLTINKRNSSEKDKWR